MVKLVAENIIAPVNAAPGSFVQVDVPFRE
jgi:hypothetical protein